jgi:phosphate transport system substrate-binding protein
MRSERLVVTGSSTVAPLLAEIGKRFEVAHPGTRVDVQTGGSSRGLADVRGGLADIGMASRALAESEQDLYAFSIARDGVCLFVHRDNPVSELSDEQVAAVYTGRIDNWAELGGHEAAITVVHKAAGRATQKVFLDYFDLADSDVRADVIVGDNEQGVKTVVADPNAIAYVSIGTAEYDAAQGVPIKLLPTAGVVATLASLADGTFPMTRPLNLVTLAEPSGRARELIDYARSPEVHDLVRELYFAPVE